MYRGLVQKPILPALFWFLVFSAFLLPEVGAEPRIPKIRHSVKPLDLVNRIPTQKELMAAGQLGGQLYPTRQVRNRKGEEEANLSFGRAIEKWNRHEYKEAVALFKKHIKDHPESPWASEAALHIGCDAQYNGKYREAEAQFRWIIEENQGKTHAGARFLKNKATLRLGVLRVYENDFEGAKGLFGELKREGSDWRQRTYASHWLQRLSRYTADALSMLTCGTQALAYLLEKDGQTHEAREVTNLLPETTTGHSIMALSEIASGYCYDLSALRVTPEELQSLPLPAIVRLGERGPGDRGHYWILEKIDGENLLLYDPQSGRRFKQGLSAFSREWSGEALVFSGGEEILPGVRLSQSEMASTFGGCCGVAWAEENLGGVTRSLAPNSLGNRSPCGSPTCLLTWSM